MKTCYLMPVLLLFMLLLCRCTREEADTTPAVELTEEEGKMAYVYASVGRELAGKPGLLTAGEWNDLANWHLWTSQLKSGQGKLLQEKWKISALHKYTVVLHDSLRQRIPDARVILETAEGIPLDESKTDNTGLCHLLPTIYAKAEDLRLKVIYSDQVFYIGDLHPPHALIQKQLHIHRKVSPVVDILWVAAPGQTISGEFEPLQATLQKVLKKVESQVAADLKIRLGSVTYTHRTDSLATSSLPFTSHIQLALSSLAKQPASEVNASRDAIDLVLEEAIYRQNWSKEATSRILFLVINTPLSSHPDGLNRMARISREAARQGIRIIPIATGSTNIQSELLLRSLAVRTGGTYIFLTHHTSGKSGSTGSGIGAYREESLENLLTQLLVDAGKVE